VPRYKRIAVSAVDADGNPLSFEAEGFVARVIQHEVDHLDGLLFLDRMVDLKHLAFREEYFRFHTHTES
jgi:peptide deformylase